jgi:hypothetical protein
MKKSILSIALCIVLYLGLFSCDNDNSGTKKPIESADITLREFTTPSFNYITTTKKVERTVYVSKSGKKIHRNKKCSGMKYYWEMSYADAVDAGYDFCEKCY